MRADARRNREAILAAAEAMFADEGIAIPIDEIAKRAGVGIGSVYRQFPTKEALFAAVVHAKLERLLAFATSRTGEPGDAFLEVLDRMVADGAKKKDLVDALAGAGIDMRSTAGDTAAALRAAIAKLLDRAQRAGTIRKRIDVGDVFALIAGVLAAAARSGASPARLFAVVRAGLRAPE